MNNVALLGRLADHPELTHTKGGTPVVSLDLAVSARKKDAPPDYIPVVFWDKLAERVTLHLTKGSRIAVEGRITTRKYTDQDGKNRKVVEVTVDQFHFADSKGNRGADNGNNDQSDTFEEVLDESGLPF